ncbi:hypothetical protein NIES2104_36970 [Leptolyngbya sp. NIES-2104]|nr:hypothetical protein NIES2104_36970 [Leptolyngbya sp. NIES-2104]
MDKPGNLILNISRITEKIKTSWIESRLSEYGLGEDSRCNPA